MLFASTSQRPSTVTEGLGGLARYMSEGVDHGEGVDAADWPVSITRVGEIGNGGGVALCSLNCAGSSLKSKDKTVLGESREDLGKLMSWFEELFESRLCNEKPTIELPPDVIEIMAASMSNSSNS